MNVHKNARLTPRGRERIVRQVESGQTPKAVAEAAGVCLRTARKWVDRPTLLIADASDAVLRLAYLDRSKTSVETVGWP
jgi:transposase-like protein